MLTWWSQNNVAPPLLLVLVFPIWRVFLLFIKSHIQSAETGSRFECWACWEKDRWHHSAGVVKQSTVGCTVDMLDMSTGRGWVPRHNQPSSSSTIFKYNAFVCIGFHLEIASILSYLTTQLYLWCLILYAHLKYCHIIQKVDPKTVGHRFYFQYKWQ